MPWARDRATALSKVLVVMTQGLGLQAIARLAEVNGMRAHIADFEHPLPSERTLNRQVPLLRARYNEVTRHSKSEDAQSIERSGAAVSTARSIIRSLRGIPAGESLE